MDHAYKQYLTGIGGGSGKYHNFHASRNRRSVEVQHLPEHFSSVRVVFRELDVQSTLLIDEPSAHCLWAALSQMAQEYNWQKHIELPADVQPKGEEKG